MDTTPGQNSDASCAQTSDSTLNEKTTKINSVLHLRLSFSSDGVQLLPPYLEQPVNLNAEQDTLKVNDIQPFLSLLSNLSSSTLSPPSSLPSLFEPYPPKKKKTPSDHTSPVDENIKSASQPFQLVDTTSSSQPTTLSTPSRSYSLDRKPKFTDRSPVLKGWGSDQQSASPKRRRRAPTSSPPPSSVPAPPPHPSSPPLPSTKDSSYPDQPDQRAHPKEKRSRSRSRSQSQSQSRSTHNDEKKSTHRISKRDDFYASGNFDQVSITFMNLPFHARKDELQAFFESCGPTKKCKFLLSSNKSFRGIAHVVYENPKSAEKAILLHNTMFRGREVSVCYTDYSLVNRNNHSTSSESPELSSSRNTRNNPNHKRVRRDHYSSTVLSTGTPPLTRKTCTVLLENLPSDLSLDQIHEEASKSGNVIRVDWANRSNTSAYLEYSRQDSATVAIKRLDKRTVNGSLIRASFLGAHPTRLSKPKDEKRRPFILKITDLPDPTTVEELKEFLRDVGPIEKLRLSNSRNVAYLEVWKDEVASAILAKNGKMLSARPIKIAPHHGAHQD